MLNSKESSKLLDLRNEAMRADADCVAATDKLRFELKRSEHLKYGTPELREAANKHWALMQACFIKNGIDDASYERNKKSWLKKWRETASTAQMASPGVPGRTQRC